MSKNAFLVFLFYKKVFDSIKYKIKSKLRSKSRVGNHKV